jgi:hypothetical protein
MRRTRSRGQATVEFGFIAILFTLLMFAIVDFSLLLNDWLTVSSDAQKLARDASVGAENSQLIATASNYGIPGVTFDTPHFAQYCCAELGLSAALVLRVTYYDECAPGPGCPAIAPAILDSWYGVPAGQCPHGPGCRVPQRPSPTCLPHAPPCPGDSVVVTLTAAGARVITPLVRPFFNCVDVSTAACYVPMGSTVSMRYDGGQF